MVRESRVQEENGNVANETAVRLMEDGSAIIRHGRRVSRNVLARGRCYSAPVSGRAFQGWQDSRIAKGPVPVSQRIRKSKNCMRFTPSTLNRSVWLAGARCFVAVVLLWAAGAHAACQASFSPLRRSHGYLRATNYVDFSATCRWRVFNTNSWITFSSATNGVAGSGRLYYTVALNSAPQPRSGNITIGNTNFLITQAGGHPVIVKSPADQSVAAGGTAKFSASIDGTSPFTCQWQRNGLPLTDGNGISGATTTNLVLTDVQPSQAGKYRVLVISPGFKKFSSKAALTVSCGFTLSASQAGFGSLGATGSVALNTVSALCRWSTVNTNSWITILSGIANSGSGSVLYALTANTASTPRSGNLQIADQTFTITQAGSAPTDAEIALAEALDTDGTLEWGTIGTPEWFGQSLVTHDGVDAAQSGAISDGTAVSAQSGITGPGTLSFWWKVSSETNKDYLKFFVEGVQQTRISGEADWRWLSYTFPSGACTLKWTYSKSPAGTAGQDRGWLDQVQFVPGPGCVGTLSHLAATHPWAGETGRVNVTVVDGCNWNVINLSSWITPVVEAGGSNGVLRYTLATNNLPASRTGVVVIAGQPFTIVQQGAPIPCAYSISPTDRTQDSGFATGAVAVTAREGCDWSVINTNDWITILSGAGGSGSGQVMYSIAANSAFVARSGNILVAGQPFTIVQQGVPIPCAYSISPATRTQDSGSATGAVAVVARDGCEWSVINTNDWITILSSAVGSGSGQVMYSVAANPTSATRTGKILVGDQFLTVRQYGTAPCSYLIFPGGQTHDAGGATGMITVTTQAGCPWGVSNSNPWITILSIVTNASGGQVTYSLSSNSASVARSGNILVAGQSFAVVQLGNPDLPQAPVIVKQPALYQSVPPGSSVQWSVAASGTGPLSYQWMFQSTPLAGANANSLALDNAQTVHAGRYQVVVSNAYGAVTSAMATLKVQDFLPGAGTILFKNDPYNRVLDVDGTNSVPKDGTLVVGLFAGPAPDSLQFMAPAIGFIVPGRFVGGMRTISNTEPNQLVWIQVKVWDSAFGDSYEEATAAGGKHGESELFQVRLGGSITPPGTLVDMPGFALSQPRDRALRGAAASASPATLLMLRRLVPSTNGWTLTLTGPVSATCVIEMSADLVKWKTVAYVVNQTGVLEYNHGDHSEGRRFYRVRLVNP